MVVPGTAEVAGEAGSEEGTAEAAGAMAGVAAVGETAEEEAAEAPSRARGRRGFLPAQTRQEHDRLVRPWRRPALRAAGPLFSETSANPDLRAA